VYFSRVPESDEVNQDWDEAEPTEEDAIDQQVDSKTSHICKVCGRVFKKLSHLKQHYRSHTGISLSLQMCASDII